MAEAFQPVAVRPPDENRLLFWVRCMVDLQLLTIVRFLRRPLRACRGRLLDVGAGEAPWRDLLPEGVDDTAVDVDLSGEFGMRRKSGITYDDGVELPFEDGSVDHVLCTEVLEHVPDPAAFLSDLHRVLRHDGTLILTVPWSARLHHLPHDYGRFTRFGLTTLLREAGFSELSIEERGTDMAVIANKLLVLIIRLLHPHSRWNCIWTWPMAAMLLPIAAAFLIVAHIALFLNAGSRDGPLGYGVIAVKS